MLDKSPSHLGERDKYGFSRDAQSSLGGSSDKSTRSSNLLRNEDVKPTINNTDNGKRSKPETNSQNSGPTEMDGSKPPPSKVGQDSKQTTTNTNLDKLSIPQELSAFFKELRQQGSSKFILEIDNSPSTSGNLNLRMVDHEDNNFSRKLNHQETCTSSKNQETLDDIFPDSPENLQKKLNLLVPSFRTLKILPRRTKTELR